MEITELVWNLFIILLPGVVATLMLRYFVTHKQFPIFEFVIYSATLGIGVFIVMELFYSIYWIIFSIFSNVKLYFGLNLSIWDKLFTGIKSVNKYELFISYLISIPFGYICGFIISKKYILSFFRKLALTERSGDDDVWSFYLNSNKVAWVFIHVKSEGYTYYGRISAYSDSTEKREILLSDVITYDSSTWTELYQVTETYLELKDFDYKIETPKIIENGNNN